MKSPARLETPRLLLTRPETADAEAIYARYASDPEVTRFLGWARHRSLADTRLFLRFSDVEWDAWPTGPYLIRLRGTGEIIGGTGLGFESPTLAQTGYVLTKSVWGRGFATEALHAMIAEARQVGVGQLYARCHAAHVASQRVLEKCGFTHDASTPARVEFPNLAPGESQDALHYTLVLAPPARPHR